MDEEILQELIDGVCANFTNQDVCVSNIFDFRKFVVMAHFAWKHNTGFTPEMFKNALMKEENFRNLSDSELESKARELCSQAEFAKSVFHVAFDLEKLSIND